MNKSDYQNIRTLNYFYGRLVAIKWVRECHKLDFIVARNVVIDVLNNEPWTAPELGPDLNKVCDRPKGWAKISRNQYRWELCG